MSKKKSKKKSNIGFIISLLVIIILIILIIYLLSRGKLSENSKLVKEIYSYTGNNDLQTCGGLITYSEDKVDFKSINNNQKICLAYSMSDKSNTKELKIDKSKKNNTCTISDKIVFATDNYEEDICTISKIEANKINESYKKIYGREVESYDAFELDNVTTCFYEDDYYYCGLSENFTYSIGAEPHTFRSIKKVEKKNDTIEIYDYFIKIINDKCYSSYTGSKEVEECTSNYQENKVNYKFLKKYGILYKHTFKKDNNDNYYWVSSEPIKN